MQSVRSRSNHVLPTTSGNSSANFPPSGKLMSISSIIATPPMYTSSSSLTNSKTYYQEPMERRASAPSHPYNYPQKYPSSVFRSPPTSPDDKLFESSTPSSPTLSVSSFSARKYRQDHDMDDDMVHPPLTLQERRLRNKAASAKYRQKKNQQQNDMRIMIGRLSEQNAVLERQLQELRLENERLKSTADKLRGKMVAKKMLKKWIGRQQQQSLNYALSSGSEHDDAVIATIPMEHDDDDDDELDSIDSQ